MILDEAIRHAEEVAEYDCYNDEQKKCSDEHRQLAEWLRELKRLRESATDTDTISRQAAIDEIKTCRFVVDAIEKIRGLPSAQPEIIRCKDCKNSEHWYRDRRRCFLWSEDGVSVFDDGFCSYAERRTDG